MITCILVACVIAFYSGYILLGFMTWIFFAALMKLRDRLDYLPSLAQRVGKLALRIGEALDFLFNVFSTFVFFEVPQEWMFSSRVKRHINESTRRGTIARWFNKNWLECIDPGHCDTGVSMIANTAPSLPDIRDYKFTATVSPLPNTDLRPFCPPIRDQAKEGACVAFTCAGLLEILTMQHGGYETLAAQFPYWVARWLENRSGQEGLYSIRDCFESLRRYGIPLESEWPYTADDENEKPTDAVFASAMTRKLFRYEAIDISQSTILQHNQQLGIDNIKSALAEGMPVGFAFAVGKKAVSMHGPLASQVGQYAPVDTPFYPNDGTNPSLGGHGSIIVGNSDALGGFIWRNQWSTSWGDQGYGLLPYECVRDFSEAWVVRDYKDINLTDPVLDKQRLQLARLYVGILGRAPELEGFLWWLKTIKSGAVAIDDAAQGFLESAESHAKFGSDGKVVCGMLNDIEAFNNRVAVALYCAVDMACAKADIANVALNGVTADTATIEPAKAKIRQLLNDGVL